MYFDSQKEAYAALQNETIDAASVYSPYASFFVTHDIDEAILLSDRIYILADGMIVNEIVIDKQKPRSEDFNLTDDFLVYKRRIVNSLHLS